jgi:hypothetical protein
MLRGIGFVAASLWHGALTVISAVLTVCVHGPARCWQELRLGGESWGVDVGDRDRRSRIAHWERRHQSESEPL